MLMNARFSDIQMVLLIVGEEKTEISVHENVLFEASPVLKATFTSNFKESSERSIYLPDDDAILMDILVQSLYAPRRMIHGVEQRSELLRLYVLAEKYDVVQVKDKICNWFISAFKTERPSKIIVEYIYENTTSKAAMRELLADSFSWNRDLKWFSDEANRSWLLSVPELAVDICAVLANNLVKEAKAHPPKKEALVDLEEKPVKDPDHTDQES